MVILITYSNKKFKPLHAGIRQCCLSLILRLVVKGPSSVSESVKNYVQHWALPFRDFPEYEVGTKRNNQVANRYTGSCLARRQTGVNFLKLTKFYGHVDQYDKTDPEQVLL